MKATLEVATTQEVTMGKRGPVPKRKEERRRRNKGKSEKDRLYDQASKMNIKGRSKMSKAQLEKAIADFEQLRETASTDAAKQGGYPPPDLEWHPIARDWYLSLGQSGQSEFYQQSDWQLARLIAENISRDLKPQLVTVLTGKDGEDDVPVYFEKPLKGASIAAYLQAMTSLMVTEGDRRRAGVELRAANSKSEEPPADPKVAVLDDYREQLGT